MARNSLQVDIPWGTRTGPASPSATYTTSSPKRRSFCSVPSGLKLGKGKLRKFWPGSKSPTITPEFRDWSASELSAVIRLTGYQMGALGNPSNALSSDRRASNWIDSDELHIQQSETKSTTSSIRRKAVPPSSVQAPPPMAFPISSPQLVPIPEPLPVDNDSFYDEQKYLRRSSAIRERPVNAYRRRAKTPVHMIGQLERAAAQKNAGVNRMSSVSTIARQYRALVDYPDEPDIPEVPSIDPKYLKRGLSKAEREAVELHIPGEYRRDDFTESLRQRSQSASTASDESTLVASEECDTLSNPLCIFTPATPAPRPRDAKGIETAATLRFQVGLDLLTRELSSAFAGQSSQASGNASGLQVWVMIEAYERLRDQIAASGTENEEAKVAIDSWLEALHAVHRNIVDEAAGSESEYEDE